MPRKKTGASGWRRSKTASPFVKKRNGAGVSGVRIDVFAIAGGRYKQKSVSVVLSRAEKQDGNVDIGERVKKLDGCLLAKGLNSYRLP